MCSVEPFDWTALVVRLGKEFARRGMTKHVKHLREFYLEAVILQRARLRGQRSSWSEGLVLEWLAIFHLAPFKSLYAVHPPASTCPKCGSAPELDHLVRIVYAGGCLMLCRKCDTRWVVERSA